MHEIDMQNKYGHNFYGKHAKKVYLKHKHRGFCRLCGCDTEGRYTTNVLSIAAVQKFLVKLKYYPNRVKLLQRDRSTVSLSLYAENA